MKRCVAVGFDPTASVAVTVMVARPALPGVTVTSDPDAVTAATDGCDEAAV